MNIVVEGKLYVPYIPPKQSKVFQNGARCPKCGYIISRVTDSRESQEFKGSTRRRRQCSNCGHRWSTLEIICPQEE